MLQSKLIKNLNSAMIVIKSTQPINWCIWKPYIYVEVLIGAMREGDETRRKNWIRIDVTCTMVQEETQEFNFKRRSNFQRIIDFNARILNPKRDHPN